MGSNDTMPAGRRTPKVSVKTISPQKRTAGSRLEGSGGVVTVSQTRRASVSNPAMMK
jgi:hypothetical protein